MAVAAEQGKRMLAAEGGDPEIVGGDRFASPLQFEGDIGIVMRGGFINV
jgi:hypothetical protein